MHKKSLECVYSIQNKKIDVRKKEGFYRKFIFATRHVSGEIISLHTKSLECVYSIQNKKYMLQKRRDFIENLFLQLDMSQVK